MLDSIFASDGASWHAHKNMLRSHTAKSGATNYSVMEKHISQLNRNLENGEPHSCFDQIDRFNLDVAAAFGESARTLTSGKQPLRRAVEKMYLWNTKRVFFGKIGALFPSNPKANGVLHSYLDQVIDKAMATHEETDSD
ncbi:MAG: hypothetical protein LQ347_003384 [Umbilicaria vellea]|nr:MAG: hypothetical protein LQ347_003384 [Umbilicaria vellea]